MQEFVSTGYHSIKNLQRLRPHSACQDEQWRTDWQKLIFFDDYPFNLEYRDRHTHIRRRTGERRFQQSASNCVIQRDTGRTPSVMVLDAIWHHGQS